MTGTTSLPPISSFGNGVPNTVENMDGPVQGNSLKFSPKIVSEILLRVLRHCFQKAPEDYRWDPDPKLSKVAIRRANETFDKDSEASQFLPRIIVSRNSYGIGQSGLNQSMTSESPMEVTKGIKDSTHMHMISGGFSIVIEATQEGTAEMLADMTSCFLTWLSTHICNTYGLNTFGLPMNVGEPAPDKEGLEKFKIVINSGYSAESRFRIHSDAYKLLSINLNTTLQEGI